MTSQTRNGTFVWPSRLSRILKFLYVLALLGNVIAMDFVLVTMWKMWINMHEFTGTVKKKNVWGLVRFSHFGSHNRTVSIRHMFD